MNFGFERPAGNGPRHGVEAEDVSGLGHHAGAAGHLGDLAGLGGGAGHGFFQKDRDPLLHQRHGHLAVDARGGGNDGGIDLPRQGGDIGHDLGAAGRGHGGSPGGIDVADGHQFNVRVLGDRLGMELAHVTGADQGDLQAIGHVRP